MIVTQKELALLYIHSQLNLIVMPATFTKIPLLVFLFGLSFLLTQNGYGQSCHCDTLIGKNTFKLDAAGLPAGSTVCLDSGIRKRSLLILNMQGTPQNRITIRNSCAGKTIFELPDTILYGILIQNSSKYFRLTGTGSADNYGILVNGDGFALNSYIDAVESTPDAKFLMLKIYQELIANDKLTITSIHMLVAGFLEKAKYWQIETKSPAWIKTVHSLLHDRWNETLNLDDLSAATGVHPGTISYYFPKYFSCTLGHYLRKLKIDRALTFIKSSEKSLTEVAYECGFYDQSHFIRTFKTYTGWLPTQYHKL
jgi:AraC-like DNA-binding protein